MPIDFKRFKISGSPYAIGGKLVEKYVDLLHTRIAEKTNDEIISNSFHSATRGIIPPKEELARMVRNVQRKRISK